MWVFAKIFNLCLLKNSGGGSCVGCVDQIGLAATILESVGATNTYHRKDGGNLTIGGLGI